MLNFMKIRQVGAELFHFHGRTDMTKLIVFFTILRTRVKPSYLVLFTEVIAVCTYHPTEDRNLSYRENVELLNVQLGGT
jgi:hypothetical protein